MSKPSRRPVSGKTLKAMMAQLQTQQTFRLRPIAAHVRFICQHWNSPETLLNVQVR